MIYRTRIAQHILSFYLFSLLIHYLLNFFIRTLAI